MDIKKYIASGILEQYVLGDLSAEQQQEVEANAQTYPEIRAELDAIELALEQLALSRQVPPSPGTYAGIRERISGATDTALPRDTRGGASRSIAPWLAIAALLAGIFFLWKWQNSENRIGELEQQIAADQTACDSVRIANQDLQRKLNILRNTSNETFFMFGSDLAPEAIAAVYVDPDQQEAYLDVVSLPTPPTDRQYQLWALVDGTPVDMGVIEIGADTSFLAVPFVADAGGYAVSLEPRGGSAVPTLDQIYVISG